MPSNDGLIELPCSLDDAKIKSLPASAYYIPNFISLEEEQTILRKIATVPKPRWKFLSHRRLQAWPSDLTKDTLLESPLPSWLTSPIVPRIQKLARKNRPGEHVFFESPHQNPNHCLINEYLPGQGIMPHKDGSAYYPVVCTISLGASLCLDIYATNDNGIRGSDPSWRILQEPRSLLITTDDLYTDYLHSIADTAMDINLDSHTIANWSLLRNPDHFMSGSMQRHIRTSLTYRDVLKVSKLGTKFGMLGRR